MADLVQNHHGNLKTALEEFENENDKQPPYILTLTEVKLLSITAVGLFIDAYDLLVINSVATMLQFRLYDGKFLPANLSALLKASANIGAAIGQFSFGYAADALGRKAVYGIELMIIIVATILCMATPTGQISPNNSLVYLSVFRILVGIGVGAGYPLSATVTADRAKLRKRGTMLAYVVSAQGWGSFLGSLATVVVLACYKHVMDDEGKTSKVDGVWRIVIGLSLIPAFGTLYQRLVLAESTRYIKSQRMIEDTDSVEKTQLNDDEKDTSVEVVHQDKSGDSDEPVNFKLQSKANFREFVTYMKEFAHLKILIGTCVCWFLQNISFYGITLNQSIVLQEIGFDGSSGTAWEKLFKIGIGNLIIAVLGFFPGYYVTVFTIEKLGRNWIQIQGFLLAGLFLAILAGKLNSMSNAAFIVIFSLLQFFFNFGANMTVYIITAEVFPTRYRASAHGISAACGKVGAIVSALAFNILGEKAGTPVVLWIFFACCILGALFTLLIPETMGRDPDTVFVEEMRRKRVTRHSE